MFSEGSLILAEVPVYRTTSDRHAEQIQARIERSLGALWLYPETGSDIPAEILKRGKDRLRNHLTEEYVAGGWRFNQVVGWLVIHAWATRLDGEYWWTTSKRLDSRRSQHPFECYGKAFELTISADMSSEVILAELRAELQGLTSERPFKGRHIDLRAFEGVAPFVDWRSVMNHAITISPGLGASGYPR